MTLDQQIRQVLAELELISHGATVRFDPSTSHGHAGSRDPTGELNPPHLRFRERFDSCRTDKDRESALEAAQAELRSLKQRTMPVSGLDGEELLRRQILEDFVGVPALDVTLVLCCTMTKVWKIRVAAGCEAETGMELIILDEGKRAKVLAYAAQNMSERSIAQFTGVSASTVRRLLDRAA